MFIDPHEFLVSSLTASIFTRVVLGVQVAVEAGLEKALAPDVVLQAAISPPRLGK